ncbi:MAG: hybrid sensor histidine kinase/response regulator [Anaerolineaceae bacterium]|nr:hybrid sensor histidine kinase/response regulator [Anaerolineaceae bacterium]
MADSSDANLLNIFWGEAGEYLQRLNNGLLELETAQTQDTEGSLREMNRLAHSLKGAARAVGINVIETLAHYMEEIFDSALHTRLKLTPEVCDLLYDGLDLIQNVINGEENPTDILAEVLARLEQFVVTMPAESTQSAAQIQTAQEMPSVSTSTTNTLEVGISSTLTLRTTEDTIRVAVTKLDLLMGEVSELLTHRLHGEEQLRDLRSLQRFHNQWQREWRAARTAYIRLARWAQHQPEQVAGEVTALLRFLETNQRHLATVNRQMTLLVQAMTQHQLQLSTITEQLQGDVSRMRLLPFDSVLPSFQRMIRDLARDTGKRIQMDVDGANVELDKAVLDALKEPIMHLLRNAVDHGIEPAAERERLGKPPVGYVILSLEQHGSEIIITIRDDGRGIDLPGIREAAVESGILTTREAAVVHDEDVYSFVFYPGLTTSRRVTPLSGRGLGMDIVRTRVESLRGRVSLHSEPGKGTLVRLLVPVSLTRMNCILLRVGGQNFAVPVAVVHRMLTPEPEDIFTVEGRETLMVDDQPVPLVDLSMVMGLPGTASASLDKKVILLHASDRTVAFQVEDLYREQELVLKTLGTEIEGAQYVSGAALLGSGEVIIVLDANDLIRGAVQFKSPLPHVSSKLPVEQAKQQRLRVLVVDDSITTRTLEKNILETAGFEVRTAIDGMEAWMLLQEYTPDVVIADVEMPNMNGLELTRRIKSEPHTNHLPVIILTSLTKPEQREAGLQSGADAYLVKSNFNQEELLRMIQSVV